MRYYKHLYLTEGLEKKKEKITANGIRKTAAECACDHAGNQ